MSTRWVHLLASALSADGHPLAMESMVQSASKVATQANAGKQEGLQAVPV